MASRSVSRVFIASPVKPDLAKHLKRQLGSISMEDLIYTDDSAGDTQSKVRIERLREVEVVMCDGPLLVEWLEAGLLPNLKWAHTTWTGVEIALKRLHYEKPKQDFIMTRPAEFSGDVMGEYVIGQIIARERGFGAMMVHQEKKEYKSERFRVYRTLGNLHLGILGYGAIGKRVAEMCKFMGMTVWAVSRTQQTSPSPHVDHFRGVESLTEVLQNVDYLCSILPNTPATCDLLSGEVLRHCQKKKTVLINIGRGNVINEESIVRAVREGWLGGAILDVFNQEPLPADSPLWTLPNVLITPHTAGFPPLDLITMSFVKNLERYTSGQPLHNIVDWRKGY